MKALETQIGGSHYMDMPIQPTESDPNGFTADKPGAKLDAGKNRLGLVIGGFARALQEVGKVGTFGAVKYTDNGWVEVPNGIDRYTDAMFRHLLAESVGQDIDDQTGLRHAAHTAWNALARLDLMLRDKGDPLPELLTLPVREMSHG